MFMKIYGKEKKLATLAGGVEFFCYWAWLFKTTIVKLEGDVVSHHLIIYASILKSNFLTIHILKLYMQELSIDYFAPTQRTGQGQ